ncbi:AzlC family ABC transporter permease [Conexibacter sp. JD483]|uniref:AzlC family ABC transporter permease n=1 Tax=unclassified Conexibacter TaxID=2627773 RepID=UPI002722753F|nr:MULTISPECIES: AzlC family ABC transporter permease [unclassified Conexibacter]MDO8187936.1 AzlC family ABC transporter permease [Conexibacter sp. CPCC 205706]MDO8200195.1 AzlC family ABC transporter permease [Conexibacter sp. CPCC 205762]MDR9369741.1 AzlC family ABC transporter permease [Conexibacter sp. JD483]
MTPSAAPAAREELRGGIRAGAPLALPMLLIGLSFGIEAVTRGWAPATPIAMSLLTFSGAAQIAVLGVLSAGGGVVAAVAAGLLVNLRFLPIGIAVGPSLQGRAWWRAVVGQGIVDVSLSTARLPGGGYDGWRLLGAAAPQWLGWQLGTVAGVVAGPRLGDSGRYGVDALFPAFFLVLLLRELRRPRARLTAVAAAAVALALIPLAPPGVPVIAGCSVVLLTAWRT